MTTDKELTIKEPKGLSEYLMNLRTPADFIKQYQGRAGNTYSYVEIGYVKAVLNKYFPFGWSHKTALLLPLEEVIKLGQVVVTVDLTINGENGTSITHSGQGGGAIKYFQNAPHNPENIVDLADDIKSAEADALKKAASSFGIAFDVYHPEVVRIAAQMKVKASRQVNKPVVIKTVAEKTEIVKSIKVEPKLDPKKEQIIGLIRQIDPAIRTDDDFIFGAAVWARTQLKLIPANYQLIIDKLNETLKKIFNN